MSRLRLSLAMMLGINTAWAADAPALLEKYQCYICHADHQAKAGPAYDAVAERYRGDPNAAAKLIAIVRKGAFRGGPWHMPPHPEVSRAQAARMVQYILLLKN